MKLNYLDMVALSRAPDETWGAGAVAIDDGAGPASAGVDPAKISRAPKATPGARWTPPPPSRASRNLGRASKRSMRIGTVTSRGRDDFESWGEYVTATCLLADPRVADVVGQPPAVTVVDPQGRTIRHTPDLGVRLVTGGTVGALVRPECRADGIGAFVDLLVGQVPTDLFEGWIHLSEVSLTHDLVKQADLVAWVRRDGPFPDSPEVERMREVVDRPMTVAAAIDASGTGPDGYRAVVRLVSDGEFRVVGHWRIHREATIEPVGAAASEVAR